jgi:hypothetical protein
MGFVNLMGGASAASTMDITKGLVPGSYIVHKYGRNTDVDGQEDVWNGGGLYTGFPLGAGTTFTTVSTSANDTAAGTGARTWRWFYLDDDLNAFDASGEFLYFDVTLAGLTPVVSTVSGRRIWRGYELTSGSGLANAGVVSLYHTGSPAVIFASAGVGKNQTAQANFTIPAGYTGYIDRYTADMLDNTANHAVMAIRMSDQSGAIRLRQPFSITTERAGGDSPEGGLRFEAGTDLSFRAESVANANADIMARFDLRLVRNT